MKAVVIDTNVPVTASGRADHAGAECMRKCIQALRIAREAMLVVLDDRGEILREYRGNLSLSGQPGPGDFFMQWVWDNQANEAHVERVTITPVGDRRRYAEFPEDSALHRFDVSDRKFVAVARASSSKPVILNAVDTGWWEHREALARNGVRVEFLCPSLMRKARDQGRQRSRRRRG